MQVEWDDPFYPKRFLGGANLLLNRRKRFPPDLGRAALEQIAREDADLVVFSGDFTTTALRAEFALAQELLAPIQAKWGERFFILPGNHDRYTPRAIRNRLYEHFFPAGAVDPESHCRVQDLDDTWTVVGQDLSRAFCFRSNGLFTPEHEKHLEAILSEQADRGRAVILTTHYPFSYPDGVARKPEHVLLNDDRLAALIERFPPVVYLHGHKHIRWKRNAAGTTCVNCGSVGMKSYDPIKHAGYALIDLDTTGVQSVTGVHLNGDAQPVHTAL